MQNKWRLNWRNGIGKELEGKTGEKTKERKGDEEERGGKKAEKEK